MLHSKQSLATEAAIRQRVTTKVLATDELPIINQSELVTELLALAGMAPFHRPCDDVHRNDRDLAGIEPWRFYVLDSRMCRQLRTQVPPEKAGKIPSMLAAADALVLATWLPNPAGDSIALSEECLFEPTLGNMEHIAACSAAIQNLLLAATSRGIASYWSSGGVLRSQEVFERLDIPRREILLGAIFLFPAETADAQTVGSKLRERRTAQNKWSRWVSPTAS